jgi:hypothetical protein
MIVSRRALRDWYIQYWKWADNIFGRIFLQMGFRGNYLKKRMFLTRVKIFLIQIEFVSAYQIQQGNITTMVTI